jgi:hypothetical protein
MAASGKLVDLLRSNLDSVAVPSGYKDLRDRLANNKPSRPTPTIKESPENVRPIGSFESDA